MACRSRTYLTNKQKCATFNYTLSELCLVVFDAPQCSISGPFFSYILLMIFIMACYIANLKILQQHKYRLIRAMESLQLDSGQ